MPKTDRNVLIVNFLAPPLGVGLCAKDATTFLKPFLLFIFLGIAATASRRVLYRRNDNLITRASHQPQAEPSRYGRTS